MVADTADGADGVVGSVLARAVILIVRVPNRPSRPKTISIPRVRRKVCAGAAGQRMRIASSLSSFASAVSLCANLAARSIWLMMETARYQCAAVSRSTEGACEAREPPAP